MINISINSELEYIIKLVDKKLDSLFQTGEVFCSLSIESNAFVKSVNIHQSHSVHFVRRVFIFSFHLAALRSTPDCVASIHYTDWLMHSIQIHRVTWLVGHVMHFLMLVETVSFIFSFFSFNSGRSNIQAYPVYAYISESFASLSFGQMNMWFEMVTWKKLVILHLIRFGIHSIDVISMSW